MGYTNLNLGEGCWLVLGCGIRWSGGQLKGDIHVVLNQTVRQAMLPHWNLLRRRRSGTEQSTNHDPTKLQLSDYVWAFVDRQALMLHVVLTWTAVNV